MYLNIPIYNQIGGWLLTLIIAIFIIEAAITLTLYILSALGLMKIAGNLGVTHGWFAWIPVFGTYLTGKIAFKTKLRALVFTVTNILSCIAVFVLYNNNALELLSTTNGVKYVNNICVWVLIAIIVFMLILNCIAYYKVYKKVSKRAKSMLVVALLTCGLMAPVFLFIIRNNQPIVKP